VALSSVLKLPLFLVVPCSPSDMAPGASGVAPGASGVAPGASGGGGVRGELEGRNVALHVRVTHVMMMECLLPCPRFS
jgi:hypothetical protein